MGVPEGLTFTLKRAEGSLHGEGCLQDVQTALCTSANRWCANLYTYIGLMVPVCSEWYVSGSFEVDDISVHLGNKSHANWGASSF